MKKDGLNIVFGFLVFAILAIVACSIAVAEDGETGQRIYMDFSKNTNGTPSVTVNNIAIDVAGKNWIWASQEIGTNAEAIALGDVTNVGYCVFHNLGNTTNIIDIGYDDSGFKSIIRCKVGEWSGPVRLMQNVPQAKSTNAVSDFEYFIVED